MNSQAESPDRVAWDGSVVTKICGLCLLLSGVLGLAAGPIGARIGYPIFADFADVAMLSRFASAAPAPVLFGLLQVCLSSLLLTSQLGFFYLLRSAGPPLVLGVVLASVGFVFTTIQDGVEITLVSSLPVAFAAADAAARPALLAIGDFGTTAMNVFGRMGIIGYVGLLLINWSMWRVGRNKRIAATFFAAFALMVLGTQLAAVAPPLGIAAALGFIVFRVWMIAAAVAMLRWKPMEVGRTYEA